MTATQHIHDAPVANKALATTAGAALPCSSRRQSASPLSTQPPSPAVGTDNGPVIVGFHTDSDKLDQRRYPRCARVIITIKDPNHNGGPARDEAQVLWDMEDRLVEVLDAASVPCLLLGRLTHSGSRELVFQVADYEPFRPPVGRRMSQYGDYETDVSEHEGWEFYFEFVWPSEQSWLLIMDRRVVDDLIEAGSDASMPHSIEFVFRGDVSGLQQMQAALSARGYTLLDLSGGGVMSHHGSQPAVGDWSNLPRERGPSEGLRAIWH